MTYIWNRLDKVDEKLIPKLIEDSFNKWTKEQYENFNKLTEEEKGKVNYKVFVQLGKMNYNLKQLGH